MALKKKVLNTKSEPATSSSALAGLKKTKLGQTTSRLGHSGQSKGSESHCMKYKGSKGKIIATHEEVFEGIALLHPGTKPFTEEIYIIENDQDAEALNFYDAKVRVGTFFAYQTNRGEFGLDFLPDSDDAWTLSRLEAVTRAQSDWVKMMYVKNGEESYSIKVFPKSLDAPKWSEDIDELVCKITQGRLISSLDHPIARHYIQAIEGSEEQNSDKGQGSGALDDLLDEDDD